MEELIQHDKRGIAKRVAKVIKTFCDKEEISRRAFCIKYGFHPPTVQHYVTDRVDYEFITNLIKITGASRSYIFLGIGSPLGENILTNRSESSTREQINIPFAWEASTFHTDKIRVPQFFLNFPDIQPFVEMAKEKEMVGLLVDQNCSVKDSRVMKNDIVLVNLKEKEIIPGKTYLVTMGGRNCIKEFRDGETVKGCVIGRIVVKATPM